MQVMTESVTCNLEKGKNKGNVHRDNSSPLMSDTSSVSLLCSITNGFCKFSHDSHLDALF